MTTPNNYDNWQLEQLQAMNNAKNYNRSIFNLIHKHLGSKILEVGCGLGALSERILASPVDKLILVEKSAKMGSLLKEKFSNRAKVHIADIYDRDLLGDLEHDSINTIVCFNLLEHLPEDSRLLSIFHELLPANGRLIVFVPAFMSIYGEIDRVAGHIRRYRKDYFINMAGPLNFEIMELRYVNLLGFFTWFINGRILKKGSVSRKLLAIYDSLIVPVGDLLENSVEAPFGQSLFCVYRKRA